MSCGVGKTRFWSDPGAQNAISSHKRLNLLSIYATWCNYFHTKHWSYMWLSKDNNMQYTPIYCGLQQFLDTTGTVSSHANPLSIKLDPIPPHIWQFKFTVYIKYPYEQYQRFPMYPQCTYELTRTDHVAAIRQISSWTSTVSAWP